MTDDRTWLTNNQNLTYRVNNGVPNQLTAVDFAVGEQRARRAGTALFVQEQWTRRPSDAAGRGAVRSRAAAGSRRSRKGRRDSCRRRSSFRRRRGVDSYKDITPRMGAAYDLFGSGRTALKVSLGKYLEGAGVTGTYANTNPTLRMPQTTSVFGTAGVTRAWTDANRNFVPDCDLAESRRAGSAGRPAATSAASMSNTSFGQNVLTNNFDPGILNGWGVRPSDWNLGVSIQQQIGRASSVEVTYIRRWFDGFSVVDNLALQPADLTPFSSWRPLDPRLPGGGGYVVSGLYDVVPEKAGQVRQPRSPTRGTYGAWYQYFNGVDVTVNVRVGQRLHRSSAARARVRPSPTTATSARACRSSRRRRQGRARSAPV